MYYFSICYEKYTDTCKVFYKVDILLFYVANDYPLR